MQVLSPTAAIANKVELGAGHPLKLRLTQELNSLTHKLTQKVFCQVEDEVRLGGKLVIAKGAGALAEVSCCKPARRFGMPGMLTVVPSSVDAIDGTKISLQPTHTQLSSKGGGSRRYWSPLVSIFLFPVPAWIKRGKQAKLLPNQLLYAMTSGSHFIEVEKHSVLVAPETIEKAVETPVTTAVQ